jgi:hypothetical protein
MKPELARSSRARTALTAVAVLIVGLAGCATELAPGPIRSPAEAAPYVGVFMDGKPLYRFPPIEVIGSRSGVGPGS